MSADAALVYPVPAKTLRDLPATQENYDLLCSIIDNLFSQISRHELINGDQQRKIEALSQLIEKFYFASKDITRQKYPKLIEPEQVDVLGIVRERIAAQQQNDNNLES